MSRLEFVLCSVWPFIFVSLLSGSPALAGEPEEAGGRPQTGSEDIGEYLEPFDVKTSMKDGVVKLQGEVASEVERDLVEQLAVGVEGVQEVDNQLAVAASARATRQTPEGTPGTTGASSGFGDAMLTAKIKAKLLWDRSANGTATTVATDNGIVTLSGVVASAAEADAAQRIASATQGVSGVNNRIKISRN